MRTALAATTAALPIAAPAHAHDRRQGIANARAAGIAVDPRAAPLMAEAPAGTRAGVPMTAGGGTELVRGGGRYAGTGVSDVYREGDRALLVHHYYDRERAGAAKLSIREIRWLDGLPEG